MTDRLKDKVVIVTGAASGLGAAQARVFAREGAKVMLADISDRGADNAAAIQADGGKAEFVRLDVSDSESWKAAVAATLAAFGSLTSLSNTAGIRSEAHTSELQSLMRISYAVFCLKKKKS